MNNAKPFLTIRSLVCLSFQEIFDSVNSRKDVTLFSLLIIDSGIIQIATGILQLGCLSTILTESLIRYLMALTVSCRGVALTI
jgi:hypothetical protein